ncbi:DNA helicase RecD, partial [Streptomyces fimicarius]
MTALPGETPGTVGTDTPQDAVSPPDTGAEGSAHADDEGGSAGGEDAPAEVSAGSPDADAVTADAVAADGAAEAPAVPELSEAQAELAAQRELRERIEKRKAEKTAPIAAGTGLSGTAAELLAAVRAVESGEKSGTAFFGSPAPAPAARRPEPAATAAQPPRAPVPAAAAPQAA